mgnify:CR=1 FL=1
MSLNKQLIELLSQIHTIKVKDGNHFRAKPYEKAKDSLILYNKPITNINDIQNLPGISKNIFTKFQEFVKNGSLSILEKAKNNPLYILQDVYGIGPKKALELVKQYNIKTIQELRENQNDVLNDVQKIGLKYYEDILKRIPRKEIINYHAIIGNAFNEVGNTRETYQIVGSYRRGAATSGDIDIIIKASTKTYKDFIQNLINQGIIIEILSFGNKKCLCIAKIANCPARRLDFMVTPHKEWAFALMYFTGSKEFNTLMRQQARDMGYSMNEHCFTKLVNGVKTKPLQKTFVDEKSIFKFLNIQFLEPQDRNAVNFKILKKRKNRTRKVKKEGYIPPKEYDTEILKHIATYKSNPNDLKYFHEPILNEMVRLANKAYYNNDQPIMKDYLYDRLVDFIKKNYPNNKVVEEGHTKVTIDDDRKMTLPYEMWSMDKVKKQKDVNRKVKQYKDEHILSVKLDGCSLGYSTEKGDILLYTRGNGKVGQNVSHLAPYLNLPYYPGISVRGEIMIKKDVFEEKYSENFANPRNFVSGVLNSKNYNPEIVKDLIFIAYELVEPVRKPKEQLEFLTKVGFNVVPYMPINNLHKKKNPYLFLKEKLLEWKVNLNIEMDGIIVTRNHLYERLSGNPKHAWAFKIITEDQIAQTVVEEMIWSPSKDGYLKPKIKVKPVNVSGTTITYVTVHNEVWRRNNGIDVGAVIEIIRSGDVIPKVHKVITPVEPKDPPSHFNVTLKGVDYVLNNSNDNMIVRMKAIHAFFEKIGAIGLGRGNVQRIMDTGNNTLIKILAMKYEDFLEVDGFKEKMATKVYNGIQSAVKNTDLSSFMAATNIFGRGLGAKKIKIILDEYPDILIYDKEKALNVITNLPGFSNKSAEKFVNYIGYFNEFVKKANLSSIISQKLKDLSKKEEIVQHPLNNKKIVFTGCRDKIMEKQLIKYGVIISSSVSKNTHIVVVRDEYDATTKSEKAKEIGIPVVTIDNFKKEFL